MESLPQNPEFRINPENFHQCVLSTAKIKTDSNSPLIIISMLQLD